MTQIITCRACKKHGEECKCDPYHAFSVGYDDFRGRKPFSSNPYGAKMNRNAWVEGFTAAEQDQATRDYTDTIDSIRETFH